VTGQHVRGLVRATSRWNRLATGGFVSHAFIAVAGNDVPACDSGGGTKPVTPGASGTVATGDDSLRLRIRTGPGTTYPEIGTAGNGTSLAITCQVMGQPISGPSGSSRQWDRLANGRYVSHAYVRSAAIPACLEGTQPDRPVRATVRSDQGPVRIRSGWSTAHSVRGQAQPGSAVLIECSVSGQYISGTVRGTDQWDLLTGGGYLSHAYIDPASGIARCARGGTPRPSVDREQAEFIASAVQPAQMAWKEYRVPVSVTIAQSIIESGWGRSELSRNHNNHFGIKCWDGWRGPIATGCAWYPTFECEPYCHATKASFRTYASVADSFRDHSTFLTTNARYRPAFTHSNDANRFLHAVWRAGYATSPTYYDQVTALMRDYNLYRYDLG
jgi:flagellar protein FlgJ